MSTQHNNEALHYDEFTQLLQQNNIIVDAAEIQGIICGMLGGGMNLDDQQWIQTLSEMVNQGESLTNKIEHQVVKMFNQVCQQFIEADFALTLCLPDDTASINLRGKALVNWIQGFLLGFGLHQNDLTNCSAEAKEALEDFSQIIKLDAEMEESEETEQAFFEVQEYVRISAMLCFNEMGKSLIDSRQQSPTVH